jgi:hypothetical protein
MSALHEFDTIIDACCSYHGITGTTPKTCTARHKGFVSSVVTARIGEFVRRAVHVPVPVPVRRSHDPEHGKAAAAATKEATSAPDTVFEDLTAKQEIGNLPEQLDLPRLSRLFSGQSA